MEIFIDDCSVGTVQRAPLLRWLERGGPRAPLRAGPLLLCTDAHGVVWLEAPGRVAPIILTRHAQMKIILALVT